MIFETLAKNKRFAFPFVVYIVLPLHLLVKQNYMIMFISIL